MPQEMINSVMWFKLPAGFIIYVVCELWKRRFGSDDVPYVASLTGLVLSVLNSLVQSGVNANVINAAVEGLMIGFMTMGVYSGAKKISEARGDRSGENT